MLILIRIEGVNMEDKEKRTYDFLDKLGVEYTRYMGSRASCDDRCGRGAR